MSHIEKTNQSPIDRLATLLDHLVGLTTAATCEDFTNLNEGAIKSFNYVAMYAAIDASDAFAELLDERSRERNAASGATA